MTDTFEYDVAECHRLLDSIAAMTGRYIGTTQSIVSEYSALNTENARLKVSVQVLKKENNRLKRWVAKLKKEKILRKEAEDYIKKHGYSGYLHRDSDVVSCQDGNVCFDFLCSWSWSKCNFLEVEIYSGVKCMLGHPESCVMIPEEEIEAEKQYYETMIRKELLEDMADCNAIEATNNSLKYHDLGA